MWYIASEENTMYLAHHGIKGQKWGRRRWQNEDGSLTSEGKERYGTVENYERAQRRKKIAIGIGAGTAAALAIGGGILAYKNRDKIKDFREHNKALKNYKNEISGWDTGKLNKVSANLAAQAKEQISAGKKLKDIKWNQKANDAITRELAKRARREAGYMHAGREALKKIFTETDKDAGSAGSIFGKEFVKKAAKGAGAVGGAALIGGASAYLAGKTEGNKKNKKQKMDRYASYMWQNPNKK